MNTRIIDDAGMRSIPATALREWAQAVLVAAGCDAAEAQAVAENLVEANLYGHDSHGIGLLPTYLRNLAAGITRPGQKVRIVADHGAIVGLDGQSGLGQTIGPQAMAVAIDRAREHGVSVVGTTNTHHLARIGRWGEQCAAEGFASIHFVNVLSRPLVAPWGGSDARLGTNPFCVAVPHHPHPLVLDFATSAVAYGKVRVAYEARVPMAAGLLMDAAGAPTTDPRVMVEMPWGALLPFAGHKGFALGLMCELLGGALSGGRVQHDAPEPSPMRNNMLSVLFAPDKLCPREEFERQVAGLAAYLRGSPLQPDANAIHLPGEPERAMAKQRERDGIALGATACEVLAAAGATLGVPAGILAGGRDP